MASQEIEALSQALARLPGLGPRSARKAVLSLLKRRNDLLLPLSDALQEAVAKIAECPVCGNLDTVVPCSICSDPRRDQSLIRERLSGAARGARALRRRVGAL